MVKYTTEINNQIPDFEVLMEPVIPLEPEDYTQALEISKRVTYQEQRWQAYLCVAVVP
ncbi:MAG: hypothetical protein F6K41_27890, partial [Symploca sp. SIO3E6]|nr:hypothetical protein [Caldora sp. SIO3E6]